MKRVIPCCITIGLFLCGLIWLYSMVYEFLIVLPRQEKITAAVTANVHPGMTKEIAEQYIFDLMRSMEAYGWGEGSPEGDFVMYLWPTGQNEFGLYEYTVVCLSLGPDEKVTHVGTLFGYGYVPMRSHCLEALKSNLP